MNERETMRAALTAEVDVALERLRKSGETEHH